MKLQRMAVPVRMLCLCLSAFLLLPLCVGCVGSSSATETGTDPVTDAATEIFTQPETGSGTETESTSETETVTETETKPIPEPLKLTSNRKLTFAPLPDCRSFLYVEGAECEAVADTEYGYVARFTMTESQKKQTIFLDYAGYMEQFGLSPLSPTTNMHIVCMTRNMSGETDAVLCEYEAAEDGTIRFLNMPVINKMRADEYVDILFIQFAETPMEVMELTGDRYVTPERTTIQVAGLKK